MSGFVPNTKQVADGGIDGRATLAIKPDNWDSLLALAQVKGGKHTANGLRDFCGVTDKTKAAVGCYITLHPVNTEAARSDAAGLGKITVSGESYRRMNLWSIADHFDDRRPHLPQMNNPTPASRWRKQASSEMTSNEQTVLRYRLKPQGAAFKVALDEMLTDETIGSAERLWAKRVERDFRQDPSSALCSDRHGARVRPLRPAARAGPGPTGDGLGGYRLQLA